MPRKLSWLVLPSGKASSRSALILRLARATVERTAQAANAQSILYCGVSRTPTENIGHYPCRRGELT